MIILFGLAWIVEQTGASLLIAGEARTYLRDVIEDPTMIGLALTATQGAAILTASIISLAVCKVGTTTLARGSNSGSEQPRS